MHADSLSTRVAQEIGAVVLRERNRLGLTQDELAFAAGVSTRVVHQVENGKETSRLDSIMSILDSLGLTLQTVPDQEASETSDR